MCLCCALCCLRDLASARFAEMEPEPEAAAYLQWPAPARPYVMCNQKEEDGSYTHGEDALGRVQPAQYRPTCCDCGM